MTTPIGSTAGPTATLPPTYNPNVGPDGKPTVNTTGSGGAQPTQALLDPQAFLQLLVAQLKYQDPANPVDTSDFMNQTAMLSQVQTMTSMASTLSDLMTAQQTQTATSMIGRSVSFLDPAGHPASGVVSAVSIHNGVSMLHVGDLAVPLSGVLEVTAPPATPPAAADAAGTADATGTGGTGGTAGTSGTAGTADATGTGTAGTSGTAGTADAGAAAPQPGSAQTAAAGGTGGSPPAEPEVSDDPVTTTP